MSIDHVWHVHAWLARGEVVMPDQPGNAPGDSTRPEEGVTPTPTTPDESLGGPAVTGGGPFALDILTERARLEEDARMACASWA